MGEPKKLTSRHRALMRRLLAGMTLKEACEELGYSLSRASVIVNSELFQEEMRRMQEQLDNRFVECEGEKATVEMVRERLEKLSAKAVQTLEQCLNSLSDNVRVSAAKEILDRSGFVKKERQEMDVYVQPTPGLIEALKQLTEDGGAEQK